jgi:hypothetical protein
MSLSARTGAGLASWLATCLAQTSRADQLLDLNYRTYAEAEAELGWLNAKGTIAAAEPFAADGWITALLTQLQTALAAQSAAIAHIKVSLTTPTAILKASLTGSDRPISWDLQTTATTDRGQFILNARVNLEPRRLEQLVRTTLAEIKPQPDFRLDFTHFECFSPLPPEPTYRFGPAGSTLPDLKIVLGE